MYLYWPFGVCFWDNCREQIELYQAESTNEHSAFTVRITLGSCNTSNLWMLPTKSPFLMWLNVSSCEQRKPYNIISRCSLPANSTSSKEDKPAWTSPMIVNSHLYHDCHQSKVCPHWERPREFVSNFGCEYHVAMILSPFCCSLRGGSLVFVPLPYDVQLWKSRSPQWSIVHFRERTRAYRI